MSKCNPIKNDVDNSPWQQNAINVKMFTKYLKR